MHSTESQTNLHVMIRSPFSCHFDPTVWAEITQKHAPSHFRSLNMKMYKGLIGNEKLFNKYFSIYHHNHATLYRWYLLSNKKHSEIGEYLCKWVLAKSLPEYQEMMEQRSMEDKGKNKGKEKEKSGQKGRGRNQSKDSSKENESNPQKNLFHRLKPEKKQDNIEEEQKKQVQICPQQCVDDLAHQIFDYFSRNQKSRKINSTTSTDHFQQNSCPQTSNSKSRKPQKKNQNFKIKPKKGSQPKLEEKNENVAIDPILKPCDFHQLYLQTFHACDGLRYIFYNFERHMKGLNEREKYNTFIRQNKNHLSINNNPKTANFRMTEGFQNEDPHLMRCIQSQSRGLSTDPSLLHPSTISEHISPLSRTSYIHYSPFGKAQNDSPKSFNRSQIIFRRIKTKNNGKFIRK